MTLERLAQGIEAEFDAMIKRLPRCINRKLAALILLMCCLEILEGGRKNL